MDFDRPKSRLFRPHRFRTQTEIELDFQCGLSFLIWKHRPNRSTRQRITAVDLQVQIKIVSWWCSPKSIWLDFGACAAKHFGRFAKRAKYTDGLARFKRRGRRRRRRQTEGDDHHGQMGFLACLEHFSVHLPLAPLPVTVYGIRFRFDSNGRRGRGPGQSKAAHELRASHRWAPENTFRLLHLSWSNLAALFRPNSPMIELARIVVSALKCFHRSCFVCALISVA